MRRSKPVPAIEVMVSKYKGQKDGQNEWEKVAGTVGDVDGRFEIKQVPAGSYYIVARCVGYAPRTLDYVGLGKNTLQIYKTQLSPEVTLSRPVTPPPATPPP